MALSNDTSKILVLIYKEYIDKIRSGYPKSISCQFLNNFAKNNPDFSGLKKDTIEQSLSELQEAGAIHVSISGNFSLVDSAIIFMECIDNK